MCLDTLGLRSLGLGILGVEFRHFGVGLGLGSLGLNTLGVGFRHFGCRLFGTWGRV